MKLKKQVNNEMIDYIGEVKRLLKLPLSVQLNSSLIRSVKYKKGLDGYGELQVEFKSKGELYLYKNVEEFVFQELKTSSSSGRYFLNNIKDKYDTVKLTA
jgi:hypothetical protein